MREPKRLVDECHGALEQSLLRAGRRLPDTERRRLKVIAALGLGSAALMGSKSALAMLSGWKKATLGAVVTCGSVGGVVAYQQWTEPASQVSDAVAAKPTFVVGRQAAAETREDEVPQAVDTAGVAAPSVEPGSDSAGQPDREPATPEPLRPEPSSPELERSETARRTTTVPTPPRKQRPRLARLSSKQPVAAESSRRAAPTPTEVKSEPQHALASADRLREELALLDRARVALHGSKPRLATRHLEQYRRRFPNGSLGFEAEVLTIQALSAAGKRQAASERARRLLDRNPNSVAASRLKRYVLD